MALHDRAFHVHTDFDRPRGVEPLPEDCFRKLRRPLAPRGEMRLALAVLEDALKCLKVDQGSRTFRPRWVAREAERWIESTDRGPLFSFENVCLVLGLEARNLRVWIRRWRASQRPAPTGEVTSQILPFPAGGDRRAVSRGDDVLEGDIIQLNL